MSLMNTHMLKAAVVLSNALYVARYSHATCFNKQEADARGQSEPS